MLYPKTIDSPRYKAKIRDLDFFPFLRCLKMPKDLKLADVKGEMVDMEFCEVSSCTDNEGEEKRQYARRFERLKRH